MSVAILVESALPDSTKLQSLLTEYGQYHRVTNGGRGRSQAWKQGAPAGTNPVVTKIVGMSTHPADERDLRVGKVTGLATKLQAMDSVPLPEQTHHLNQHHNIYAALKEQKESFVSDYIPSGVIVWGQSSPTPISAPAPMSAPTQTLNIPMRAASDALVTELAVVPPKAVADKYLSRKVVGNLTEFDIYDDGMARNINVLIKGHAGSGKTMSVVAYAAARNLKYYNISSHAGVDTTQLFGKWNPTPDGSLAWCDGAVTHLVRTGGVLLINEVNFLPERISTALFSLLDDRREIQLADKDGEVVKAHPDLLIVADMNPNYRGTRPLNKAWADRFKHSLEFPYDPSIEAKLIKNKAVLELAAKLRAQFDAEELDTPISTRGLVAFMGNMQALGYEYAVYSFVNGFDTHEQQSVKLVFDTYADNILAGQTDFKSLSTDSSKEVI